MLTTVRVWDLPTRLFHWMLLICVAGAILCGQIGGEAVVWHFRFGYAILNLLLFRIIWGLIGGHWSRFSSFIYAPVAVFRYLKGEGRPEHSIGHNPLGSISVFALLGILLSQVASGLISDDEIAAVGPLNKFVSNAIASNATFYHKDIGKWILVGLVVIHIVGILFYLLKKGENLVHPMIQGDKKTTVSAKNSRDDMVSRLSAVIVFLACSALVAWMTTMQIA